MVNMLTFIIALGIGLILGFLIGWPFGFYYGVDYLERKFRGIL